MELVSWKKSFYLKYFCSFRPGILAVQSRERPKGFSLDKQLLQGLSRTNRKARKRLKKAENHSWRYVSS